jgi:hypothetical protein
MDLRDDEGRHRIMLSYASISPDNFADEKFVLRHILYTSVIDYMILRAGAAQRSQYEAFEECFGGMLRGSSRDATIAAAAAFESTELYKAGVEAVLAPFSKRTLQAIEQESYFYRTHHGAHNQNVRDLLKHRIKAVLEGHCVNSKYGDYEGWSDLKISWEAHVFDELDGEDGDKVLVAEQPKTLIH